MEDKSERGSGWGDGRDRRIQNVQRKGLKWERNSTKRKRGSMREGNIQKGKEEKRKRREGSRYIGEIKSFEELINFVFAFLFQNAISNHYSKLRSQYIELKRIFVEG